MNIDIRSIPAFEKISDSSLKVIQKETELLKYPIGYPICNKELIPNKVQIILSGEARLLHGDSTKASTISKLKSDQFIGLSSLLRAQGCESVTIIFLINWESLIR